MKNKLIILLCCICFLASCSVLKKVGQSIGIVEKESNSETVDERKTSEKISIKREYEKRINIESWLIWSTVLLALALSARYYLKNIKDKNE